MTRVTIDGSVQPDAEVRLGERRSDGTAGDDPAPEPRMEIDEAPEEAGYGHGV